MLIASFLFHSGSIPGKIRKHGPNTSTHTGSEYAEGVKSTLKGHWTVFLLHTKLQLKVQSAAKPYIKVGWLHKYSGDLSLGACI